MTFEQALRAGLAAEGVAMGAPGRAGVPAHGPIAAGGRDDAGTREAGRLSRAVVAGKSVVWEAISEMQEFCRRFEGSDKPQYRSFRRSGTLCHWSGILGWLLSGSGVLACREVTGGSDKLLMQ